MPSREDGAPAPKRPRPSLKLKRRKRDEESDELPVSQPAKSTSFGPIDLWSASRIPDAANPWPIAKENEDPNGGDDETKASANDCSVDDTGSRPYGPELPPPANAALSPPPLPPPFSGLNNAGNTCYVNSVLQALRYCPDFVSSLNELDSQEEDGAGCEIEDPSSQEYDATTRFYQSLKNLYSSMTDLEKAFRRDPASNCTGINRLSVCPETFIDDLRQINFQFTAYMQHDAQELLRCLLSNIEDAYNAKYKDGTATTTTTTTNFVTSTFQGSLVFTTRCLECETKRNRYETFLDVSVPVRLSPSSSSSSSSASPSSTSSPAGSTSVGRHSLTWAMKQFVGMERLTGRDRYYCDECRTHTEAEISTMFDRLPSVLTIHLKRFAATGGGGLSSLGSYVSKISGNLATPMRMKLDQWCTLSCNRRHSTYELFAVVMHNGCMSGSGHYLTYVRLPSDEPVGRQDDCSTECVCPESSSLFDDGGACQCGWKWLKLDDSDVEVLSNADFRRVLSPKSTLTSTPYILFYGVLPSSSV